MSDKDFIDALVEVVEVVKSKRKKSSKPVELPTGNVTITKGRKGTVHFVGDIEVKAIRRLTPEHRAAIAKGLKGHVMTSATKRKIGAKTAVARTEEYKENLRRKLTGRKHTPEAIAKMKAKRALKPPITDEARRKISEAMKRRNAGSKNPNLKAISTPNGMFSSLKALKAEMVRIGLPKDIPNKWIREYPNHYFYIDKAASMTDYASQLKNKKVYVTPFNIAIDNITNTEIHNYQKQNSYTTVYTTDEDMLEEVKSKYDIETYDGIDIALAMNSHGVKVYKR